MKLVERVGAITETALNLMLVTKLMKPASVEALKKTGLLGSNSGGLDNPFSIEKERKNIYSGRAELEPNEQKAFDDFVVSLQKWEYLEFFEKFGDENTDIPKAPRAPQGQQPQKQYSRIAMNLRVMLDYAKSANYNKAEIHKGLELQRGLFKQSILNPYYDLYQAAEKLNMKKLFDKIKQADFRAVAQKANSWLEKLAEEIEKSTPK